MSNSRFPMVFVAMGSFAMASSQVFAHPDHPGELDGVGPALSAPGFFLAQAGAPSESGSGQAKNRVQITIEGEFRVIRSNGWPDHTPGRFPNRGNPNTAKPMDYTFRVPVKPAQAAIPRSTGGWWVAVALNGVPFEANTGETWNNDPSSGWRYEAATGFLDLGLDQHNAHVQPPGAYHYHAMPNGLVNRLGNDGSKMVQVGWAADGYPMYTQWAPGDPADPKSPLRKMKSSYRLKQGNRPQQVNGPGGKYDGRFTQDFEYVPGLGDLDECNGRFGVTPEFPNGTYYYCITEMFPFVPRFFRGTPDASFNKGGPQGPGGPGGPGGGMGMPPVEQTLDANNDGVIDKDELLNAPAALKKLDKNNDGKLTPDELRPRMRGR